MFGGDPGGNKNGNEGYYLGKIGQDYVYASSENEKLLKGLGFLGDSTADPVGATFDEIYNGNLFYVVWNDQFYGDPKLPCEGSGTECGANWGHSKRILAWDASGNGFVMQVTTPDWPGSGSSDFPRAGGNSLACTETDNDVLMSQDFFALKLTKDDLLKVLAALAQEGAVTQQNITGQTVSEVVKPGGPQDVLDALGKLGIQNTDATVTIVDLSTGVKLISKAGGLNTPPWQLVSATLGGVALRVASFWTGAKIYSTTAATKVSCLPAALGRPGPVEIATTGTWDGTPIGLTGGSPQGLGPNHAKIGVSTEDGSSLTIFGDMNQDGILSSSSTAGCAVSQNKRGGMFFVVDNAALHDGVKALLAGNTAPTRAPAAKLKSSASKANTP
jgi:hypothetical protein